MDPSLFSALAAGLAAVVGAVGGALVTLRRLPIERKAAEAEAANAITKAAGDLICDLRDEMTRQKLHIEDLDQRYQALDQRYRTLTVDFERQREDLLSATKRIRTLEKENLDKTKRIEQLMVVNHDLVTQLAEEQDKRRALEEKLDAVIENGKAGRGGEPP